MTVHQLLALSLLLSILASSVAWAAGVLTSRFSDDPHLRDAVWGGGLVLSLLPIVSVALLLLTPAPVREVAVVAAPVTTAETVLAAPTPAAAVTPTRLDPNGLAWVALGLAGALSLIRLAALILRVLRLAGLITRAAPAGADLQDRIATLAARLDMAPPRAVVSPTTGEALLAGLGRPYLVLPADGETTSDAVLTHELAHLKRGDHRTLWLEEALAVVLAFNPLIPVLRARRDAAREEACDAVALTGADAEGRRAYAQTLIQAMRDRAGPHGARGPRVVLTFTGAGRTIAMNRLNAVMTPAAPADRRARWMSTIIALATVVAVGGSTAAVAAHRAPEVRLNSVAASTPPTVEDAAPRAAVRAALNTLPVDTQARFQRASAEDYQRFCASGDAAEEGFCSGVLFAHLSGAPKDGVCLPAIADSDNAGLDVFVARAKAEIVRLSPRRDEGAYEYSERALRAAYPCRAAALTPEDTEWLTVQVRQPERTPLILTSGDRLNLTLSGQDEGEGLRHTTKMEIGLTPDQPVERQVGFTLRGDQLPGLTRGRIYELTAELVTAEGRALYAAEPVTVRLAPGSRGRIAGLRPELVLTRVSDR